MVEELYTLRTRLGFSREDVLHILRNGIESTWASLEKKAALLAGLARAAG
jgi:adenosine deaminase